MSVVLFSNPQGALRHVLDAGAVHYRDIAGWQSIRCVNREAHSHGDRTPSASVNLGMGRYNCHACGLHGDGYDVAMAVHGLSAIDLDKGMGNGKREEPTWIL